MTRWTKLIRDIWINRSRTVLVVISIAVGVFALGMIAMTRQALSTSLQTQYLAIRPADAIIQTEPVLDDDFISSLRHIKGVEEAEGRRSLALRLSVDGKGETWRDMTLYSLSDYEDQRLFKLSLNAGQWPPEKGQVLLERATMEFLGLNQGDEMLIKTADGKQARLEVSGSVLDLYRIPPLIEGWLYGYVDSSTIRWLGEQDGYNEVYLDTTGTDRESINALVEKASDRIEAEGLPIYQKTLPDLGEHPLNYIIDTVLLLLGLLAGLAMLLSALLVVNIISALIAQQERQIGIMKAIGARSWQIMGLYFSLVVILGLAAVALAAPLSTLGARWLASFVAGLMNFDAPVVEFNWQAVLLQLSVGVLVPVLAAAPSILGGTRVSPAKVLSEYGINQVWAGAGWMDRLLAKFPRLSRTSLLALRNPFRKRARLILSLVTLTFAGATFMASINLQASLNQTLNSMFGFWRYDSWMVVDGFAPGSRLQAEARSVEGVSYAETWNFGIARYVRPDGSESKDLYLMAPPAGTSLINPPIIAGRKLTAEDTDGIIVSPGFLADEPELHLGGRMNVKIEGREQEYTIVGIMNMMGNSTIGYFTLMNYDTFARHIRESNRANAVIMQLDQSDLPSQQKITSQVEDLFDRKGLDVVSTFLIAEEREEINGAFAVIVGLLMVMTLLLATVGGLGLTGTMSLNVIERTREIGVMRAFGGSSRDIFKTVIIEGLLIGGLSWLLSIGLAIPISLMLSYEIGMSFMQNPLETSYSVAGILLWALLVMVISVVASVFPAMRAVRLTVTQVLAYE